LLTVSALGGCGGRLGVDAECAEARGQVLDPLWWCPVVRQHLPEGSAEVGVQRGLGDAGWAAIWFPRELAVVRAGYCGPDPFHDLVRFVLADLDELVHQVAALGGD